ncbi:(+)-cis,trans-nepetalactol synthase NEPS1-like [Ziziphus jujuba]|uniref:(+)-cis,trans-nepetalactol synthase NEPS1-like n=1 Tax=Ziziphus jujuba TaxID=326968 RepID=A0A6P3ZTW4_ZIZJJ|nr:(+)-cis,trans-nepetalactol synthase NEPS1-like [Ziziphus jujuba]
MADLQQTKSKKLEGKVAIVTGGASGIGEATAHNFINHGARAVVIADIQDEKGQNVAASIGPDRCTYIHCNVTDENQVKSLVESTVSIYGRLDIVFSNAGIINKRPQTVLELDLLEFDKVITVNTRGAAACVKHAARVMKEGGVKGSIICMASALASRGFETSTDYTMSKSAVIGLVRSASLQLAGDGIRVNSVSPGVVGTPAASASLGVDEDHLDEVVEKFSRMKGVLRMKHVSDAVSFLASHDSEFVTGIDLVVDGGFTTPQDVI